MPVSGGGQRLAIFTICSNNYRPFAQVLFASLRRHHPEAALFLCLADRLPETPSASAPNWTVIEAHHLPIPDFPSFAFRYDIMEFNTALKPFMVLHLLEDRGFDSVIYFDPDIEVFAPLTGVVAALAAGASFFFTPHLCAPSEDRREPNDLSIMRAGAYNLGFLGVSRTDETLDLLGWWARRLRYQCVNAQAEGLFVDQKFMDLIPSFTSKVAISHDTTLNVAYWNLEQRALAHTADGWTVDGAPLTFFHFSGFNPRLPDRLSKHDPRFVGDLSPPLSALTAHYAERLWAAGYGASPAALYAYGQFASGTAIHPAIRTMFRDWHPFWGGDPFRDYEAYLDEPWPEAARAENGQVVTNLMRFLQGVVPQLHKLDLRKPEDAARLICWFVTEADDAVGLDPALVEPAAARLEGRRPVPATIPTQPPAVDGSWDAAGMTTDQDPDALLRQARHLAQCQAVDLERAQRELAATRARAATSASQLGAALQRVAKLEEALLSTQAEQARVTAGNVSNEAGLRAEIALLTQHRDEAQKLRQSLSWRVTRPLRALRRPRGSLRILLDRLGA